MNMKQREEKKRKSEVRDSRENHNKNNAVVVLQ